MTQDTKPIEILLVEDNEGDILLTKKAFQKANIPCHMTVAVDGDVAMKMLRHEGEFESYAKPDLILLDINLPRKNGKEVLAEIRNSEDLRRIPVIMLTSSQADKDIAGSYELYASSYIVKPDTMAEFQEVVKALQVFWFGAALLSHE